jgi:predicted DNA-binding WGR domain protein
MTSAALEAYLSRLERELRKRGLQDRRIVDEAREHLFDAVEGELQRGLSIDAAESEALVRFGPPEMVAAYFARNEASDVELAVLHADQTRRAYAQERTAGWPLPRCGRSIALSLRSSTEAAVP